MTHKLILKVKKVQLFSAECFGTVEEKPSEGGSTPPPPHTFKVKMQTLRLHALSLKHCD